MCGTCFNVIRMSKMVQIRNMPEGMHRVLKSRAAAQGMSLSDYLLSELRQIAELPTLAEMRERLRSRSRVNPDISSEEAVRAERDSR
jgi:plasmid stability protein